MKIKSPTKSLMTLVLTLGFLPLALCSNSAPKEIGRVMSASNIEQNILPIVPNNKVVKKPHSFFDKLEQEAGEVLELTLTTDLQNLIDNKKTNDYQKAFIQYQNSQNQEVSYELKVKPRGKFRRRICDFPPLKLNFDKDDLKAEGLYADFDKFKLVTHCTDSKVDAKENVLREYLTYKMYNVLTDNSFRVILTKIKYVDLKNDKRSITRYGFLIENTDELAMRMNGEECECHGLKPEMLVRSSANTAAMFQYMIGNEDWSNTMLRNVKAIKLFSGGEAQNIMVPYDFDFSGLVDAAYAIPDPDLQHTIVKQRHFFGNFASEAEFQKTAKHFVDHKQEIFDLVKNMKKLSGETRYEIKSYLEEFYSELENPELAKGRFL